MILVSVGSQKFQFNRLLKEVDRLIEEKIIEDTVFAQIGVSDYKPKNYEYVDFLTQDEFNKKIDECSLIITHAGTGIIINSLKKGKKVIALPRLVEYGEHVDNHQIQLLKEFENSNLIKAVYDVKDLKKALSEINQICFIKYESNTENIINNILNFIEG